MTTHHYPLWMQVAPGAAGDVLPDCRGRAAPRRPRRPPGRRRHVQRAAAPPRHLVRALRRGLPAGCLPGPPRRVGRLARPACRGRRGRGRRARRRDAPAVPRAGAGGPRRARVRRPGRQRAGRHLARRHRLRRDHRPRPRPCPRPLPAARPHPGRAARRRERRRSARGCRCSTWQRSSTRSVRRSRPRPAGSAPTRPRRRATRCSATGGSRRWWPASRPTTTATPFTVRNWSAAVLAEPELDLGWSLLSFWIAPFFANTRSERRGMIMIRDGLANLFRTGYEAARPVDAERVRYWQAFHAARAPPGRSPTPVRCPTRSARTCASGSPSSPAADRRPRRFWASGGVMTPPNAPKAGSGWSAPAGQVPASSATTGATASSAGPWTTQ